jgi:hypothetical protein
MTHLLPLRSPCVGLARRWRAAAVVAVVAGAGTAGVHAATSQPTPVPVAAAVTWAIGGRYLGREDVRMQQGDADCGVAALAMVLERHGRAPRLEEVRRRVLERGRGLSLLEMQELAREHGLEASGWRLELEALARAPLPAVAHYEDHYVVVDRIDPDGTVHVRDPSLGRVAFSAGRFRRLWTGAVLLFGPVPSA